MPKLTVITDINGKVMGTVRSDPVQTDQGELQFRVPRSDRHAYQEIEVPDELLSSEPDQLHARVAELIRAK
jgi:hypothetical protein